MSVFPRICRIARRSFTANLRTTKRTNGGRVILLNARRNIRTNSVNPFRKFQYSKSMVNNQFLNITRRRFATDSGVGGGIMPKLILVALIGCGGIYIYMNYFNSATSMPEIKSKHSLVNKYLTPEIYNKLKDKKTKTSHCTLDQCIACAVEFDNQHCGIYAGDYDCYVDFADLFFPIENELGMRAFSYQ
eukprot:163558_1